MGPQFFPWFLVEVVTFSKHSLLLGCPSNTPYIREKELLLGHPSSKHVGTSGVLASPASRLVYIRQKLKPRELTNVLFLLQSTYLVFFLLSKIHGIFAFILYLMPRLLAVLSRKNWEKYVYSIFLEA